MNIKNLYALDEFDEMADPTAIKDTEAPKDYWVKSSSIIVSSEDFGSKFVNKLEIIGLNIKRKALPW